MINVLELDDLLGLSCEIGDVLLLLRVCLQGILRCWPSALQRK